MKSSLFVVFSTLVVSVVPASGCLDPGALQMPSPPGGSGATGAGGSAHAAGRAGGGPSGPGGAPGAAGTSAPDAGGGAGIPLVTNADGWLEPNPAQAVGRWWSAGDSFAADGTPGGGPCTAGGFPMTACSTLTTPTPGMPFRPDPNGRGMCTSGTAAQVLAGSDGQPAWSSIWGNIVGVDLATSDPMPVPVVGAYDALAHRITGFAFDIDGSLPLGHFRVLVGTAENDHDAAYWYGAANDVSPFQGSGHYEIRWPEIGGPLYLGGAAPPFDPTAIEWIAFHVVSREFEAASYAFCISNVVLLTN